MSESAEWAAVQTGPQFMESLQKIDPGSDCQSRFTETFIRFRSNNCHDQYW